MSSSLPFPDTHFLHKHISDLFCEEWKTEIVDHPGWYLFFLSSEDLSWWLSFLLRRPQWRLWFILQRHQLYVPVINLVKNSTDAYACHLFCADHSWFVSSIQRRAQLISVIYLVKISADVCHLSIEDLGWCSTFDHRGAQLLSVIKLSLIWARLSCKEVLSTNTVLNKVQ